MVEYNLSSSTMGALLKVICQAKFRRKCAYDTSALSKMMGFSEELGHHDFQQFMTSMLEHTVTTDDTAGISDTASSRSGVCAEVKVGCMQIFGGKMVKHITCLNCKKTNNNNNLFIVSVIFYYIIKPSK